MIHKILYIGKFKLPYSTENYVTYALERLGQNVVKFSHEYCEASWLPILDAYKPDIVLFSKAPVNSCDNLLELCRSRGITTVCWLWDLYFGCLSREVERWPQFESDLVFTTDGGHEDNFKERGYNHRVLRQGIHFPEAIKQPTHYRYRVGFLGHRRRSQPGRSELVNHLERTYGKYFSYVNNVRGLDLNKWLASVEVVVGDSWPSPNYWSNRVFEVLGRGGFLLHPETDGLDKYFQTKVHLDTYERGNFDNLDSQIDYYLSAQDLQESIRDSGHQHCKLNHTYTHRCETLLNHIENYR